MICFAALTGSPALADTQAFASGVVRAQLVILPFTPTQRQAEALGTFGRDKLRAFCARTDYLRWEAVEPLIAQRDELAWYLLNFALWHEMWIEK